jgi:serine/threonine-protein kinase
VTSPVREGDILAGKYRVDRVLGAGGMGIVVAAHHIDLDEKVAIKFLLPETLANAEAVGRFAREARAAVKIKSEHVARVSDVGRLENGAPYMVMEHLEGGDLSTWLGQRGALPVEQAVEFILQACEAIAEAHALGIIHRDLKPANLFVIRRPDSTLSVKVLDFGISKMTSLGGSAPSASITKTAALIGSPLYMSPEQMQSSKNVDARGDIWALGIILYELVAGTPPFTGETMPELVLQIMSSPPARLADRRPDVPPGLEAVIGRCLEKDRGKRFESVGELAIALLPFAPKRSKVSVERISGVLQAAGFSASSLALPPSSDQQSQAIGAGTAASWGRTAAPKGRGPWLLVGAAGAVVVIGAVAFVARHSGAGASVDGSSGPAQALSPDSRARVEPARAGTPSATGGTVEAEQAPNVNPATGGSGQAPNAASAVAPFEPSPGDSKRTLSVPTARGAARTARSAGSGAPAAPPQPAPDSNAARPTAAPRAPTPSTSADCTQKFYFDAQGNKHFKPDCFH